MDSNFSGWLAGITAIVLVLIVGYWLLNRSYGETSEQGYRYAMALFSICNQKDETRLRKIEEMISASSAEDELHAEETRWLLGIVERGRNGDWEEASQEVRRLIEDQVEWAASLQPIE